ncbi:MAG: DinB family protein [Bacteroidota bacterium]
MKEFLVYYCQYNVWANQKIVDFLANQSEDLLATFVENSFPSIRETVLHIISAEQSWLARMQQDVTKNKRVDNQQTTPTQAYLAEWLETSKAFSSYVEAAEASFLDSVISYNTWDGVQHRMAPKTMIHHCMNHSTYHRGQLITMARQLSITEGVPSTDLLYYSRTV